MEKRALSQIVALHLNGHSFPLTPIQPPVNSARNLKMLHAGVVVVQYASICCGSVTVTGFTWRCHSGTVRIAVW